MATLDRGLLDSVRANIPGWVVDSFSTAQIGIRRPSELRTNRSRDAMLLFRVGDYFRAAGESRRRLSRLASFLAGFRRAFRKGVCAQVRLSSCLAVVLSQSLIFAAVAPLGATNQKAQKSEKPKTKSAALAPDKQIIHLLNRIGYGPRPGDIARVRELGISKYIDEQLHPERIDDHGVEAELEPLQSLHMSVAEAYSKYPAPNQIAREMGFQPQNALANAAEKSAPGKSSDTQAEPGPGQAGDAEAKAAQKEQRDAIREYYLQHGLRLPQRILMELQGQKLIRAVDSQRQLQEVMTDFWFNHFNIFWDKGFDRWMTTDFEMKSIRPHTLGKFEDLLMATAKSPAMLFYLDNFLSSTPNPRPARQALYGGPFEGVRRPPFGPGQGLAPNPQKRKPGINENYARELMELHTLGVDGGYTQKDVQEVARCFTGWTIDQPRKVAKFIFRPRIHDDGEKMVLGHRIPAGGGQRDGEMVIEILAHHPSTAKFISAALVRRFVSDTPPQPLVDKVAQVFMETGGDIREMMRTILSSQEFNSADAYRNKIKSPFELAASAIRAMGGETDGSPALGQLVAKMGEPLYRYQAPTGYPDRASQWVNAGALLQRVNFSLALSANRIPGTTVRLDGVSSGLPASNATSNAMDRAIMELLDGDITGQTRAILEKQFKEDTGPTKQITGEGMGAPIDRGSSMGHDSSRQGDSSGQLSMNEMTAGNSTSRPGAYRPLQRGVPDWPIVVSQISTPSDPEVAKAFGLVVGSPEFQRR
jgi:uncharacterized protein (DUF1800 family)